MSDSDISDAISDPSSRFPSPRAVVDDESLTDEQKVRILQSWEFDVREKAVAEEENMAPAPASREIRASKVDLNQIREALREIVGDRLDTGESGGPTKHGSTPPAADLVAEDDGATMASLMQPDPAVIHEDHSVAEALAQMPPSGIMFVVDGDELVGFLTDEDASAAQEATPGEQQDPLLRIAAVMKAEVPYCLETDTVAAVRRTLKQDHFRCLAVLNERRELVGLASVSDILAAGRKKGPADRPPGPRHLKQDSLRARVPALKAKTSGRATPEDTQAYSMRPVLRQRHAIDDGRPSDSKV